ncbi:MAG: GNAT family N-acetyltransferase [Flavobacteriaceae bacterium]
MSLPANNGFNTERLLLTPTTIEDAPFIFELLNTPKWLEHIGDRNINSIKDAENYIREKIIPNFKTNGAGNYTVVRKDDGTKIGSCGLYDRDGVEGIDIGYAFLPNYEGMGYAFEAASKIKTIATTNFGITTISAITSQTNFRSQKLLEKLEFEFQNLITIPNDPEQLMLYKFNAIK